MSVTFTAATRTFSPEFNAHVIADLPEAEELSVNMSNSNAFRVCQSLGIDLEAEGWCGGMPAEDFLGRVLVALAIEPVSAEVPTHELPREHNGPFPVGPRWVECGRPEGYTQDRLGQLRTLADWAVAHGAEISFG